MTKIKFAKVKPNAIIPTKRDEDAGFDLYACLPEEKDWICIPPHTSVLIPTGISSAFSSDYAIIFRERGSTGTKNMKVNAGVIDSGFRGEYFVSLYNGNKAPVYITKHMDGEQAPEPKNAILYPYTKAIAQALVIPVPKVEVEEISYEELKAIPSERGIGALGSSNK
jgi:dUTP pyrophosphatase